MKDRSRGPAADGPNLAPIAEVALLELAASGPSPVAIDATDDRPPVRSSVQRCSDADGLAGRAGNDDLEAIADLKIGGGGARSIRDPRDGSLRGHSQAGNSHKKQNPHPTSVDPLDSSVVRRTFRAVRPMVGQARISQKGRNSSQSRVCGQFRRTTLAVALTWSAG